jgi:gamma-polyglutamate biosynthesis protein CapC
MLKTAVALSIILGFLSQEFLGLASGGLVSAGYLAFYFNQPYRIVSTLALAIVVYFTVNLLEHFLFIYGRRRFACCVLLGIIYAWLLSFVAADLRAIGYVVPGLIANDMLKQGVFKTLVMLLIIGISIVLLHLAGVF